MSGTAKTGPVLVVRPEDRDLRSIHPDDPSHPRHEVRKQLLSEDEPYVHLIEVPAGHELPEHSHSEPEVTVVLSGSLVFGDTECPAGTVLLVPADAAYGLRAGDDGPLTFAVVRPRVSSNDLR